MILDEWNRSSHAMKSVGFGVWEIRIPHLKDGSVAIPHNSKIKISMITPSGERIERLPAYTIRAVQELSKYPVFESVFWNPMDKYSFKYESPIKPTELKIYEAHGKTNSF